MRLLTDSYYKEKEGIVSLSGASLGAPDMAMQRIAKISGGTCEVQFHSIDEYAKKLVRDEFGTEYAPSDEAYIIKAEANGVHVYADGEHGKLYAAYSIVARCTDGKMNAFTSYSSPYAQHRSIRVFLPPHSELPFFVEYLDTLVELGYNAIVLELGGAMEYKSHPEINETWVQYCDSMREFNEKVYTAQDAYKRVKNSIHTFNADGEIYTHEELAHLASLCRERMLEIIPEVPSLSHSEYILISHPEMRECDDEDFASTACPQCEEFYRLVFDLYDEVIEVFNPNIMHIGHDEWWVMCICDKCRDKDAAELFAYNVKRCYDYLAAKGVKTMLWSDKLKAVQDKSGECHGAARKEIYALPTDKTVDVMGKKYTINEMHWFNPTDEAKEKGFLHVIEDTQRAIDLLPKDIICLNWYHSYDPEINDIFLRKGFPMIYGNCAPARLPNVRLRFSLGAQGISVSSWTVTREHDLQLWQSGFFYEVGYGALVCWDAEHSELDYEKNAARVRKQLFERRNEKTLSAPHLKVRHVITESISELEGYYNGRLPYCEDDVLTLGDYVVEYSDGSTDSYPVIYAVNASLADAKTGRAESGSAWYYAADPKLNKIVPQALPIITDDGFVYECVFPLKKASVAGVSYVPRKERVGSVKVAGMEIIGAKQAT